MKTEAQAKLLAQTYLPQCKGSFDEKACATCAAFFDCLSEKVM